MKNAVSVALKVSISALILYFLFRSIDVTLFWKTVTSVNPMTVVLAAFIFIASQGISTLRWLTILRKDLDISYLRLLSIYFIGMYFNNFLPTIVGGDLVKGWFLYKVSNRGDLSVASIFLDRYSGFAALISITALALIPGYALIADTELPAFFAMLIGGFVCISLVIWVGPLHSWAMGLMAKVHFYGLNKKIDTFYKVLMGYKSHGDILLKIFICSVFVQGGVMTGYYVLGRGLGINVAFGYYLLFIPLITAVSMLPISLSGLGLREGMFVFLFTRVGASKEQAITLSLMWFMITALTSLIGGVEYMRMGGKRGAVTPDAE